MLNGVIVMTGLVPTVGHQHLISFASKFMQLYNGKLYVIVCTRSFEPIHSFTRVASFMEYAKNNSNIKICEHSDDNAPQQPNGENDTEFWDYWRNVCHNSVKSEIDYVFASEKYGIELAKSCNAIFVPCDIERQTFNISSTQIRQDPYLNFDMIMPAFRDVFKKKITFYGAESTGKTTMAKLFGSNNLSGVSKAFHGVYVPEWARSYLETVGSEVTEEKMKLIAESQCALQEAAFESSPYPFVYQDTDLMTTLGYYRLYNITPHWDINKMIAFSKSDLYIVMNDQIPFESDSLRYGGNKRESNTQYWIDLLNEYELDYYIVHETKFDRQVVEILRILNDLIYNDPFYVKVASFKRD